MGNQLTENQRGLVAEKIMEWGNLVFVGVVIAQIVPGPFSNLGMAIGGILSIAGAYCLAIILMKGGRK